MTFRTVAAAAAAAVGPPAAAREERATMRLGSVTAGIGRRTRCVAQPPVAADRLRLFLGGRQAPPSGQRSPFVALSTPMNK